MNQLKSIRKKSKLTQLDVAKFLNIPLTTYASYEQEYRGLPVEVAIRLGSLYNVPWSIFFENKVRELTYKSE